MKAIVVKSFVDKDNQKLKISGSVVKYGDKRAKFLLEKGYLKAMEDPVNKAESVNLVVSE